MRTIRPDEAMGQLFAQPAQRVAEPAEAAPEQAGAHAELDIMARLAVCLDGLTEASRRLAAARENARLEWAQCHPIQIPPNASTGPGTLQDPDRWGPRKGWAWLVTRLTGTLGPAGTSMSIYRDAVSPVNLLLGPVSSGAWEPKGLVLLPGQALVWSSAGDALTVSSGDAVEIAIDALPAFLM